MRKGAAGLAEEKRWPLERMQEALAEAFAEGLLEADSEAQFLSAPKFLKYNPPESPNVVKAWAKCWDDLPECELKDGLWYKVTNYVKGFGKGFQEAWRMPCPKASPKASPNQEQEQEQEHF
jgi:hypothetical protein